MNIVIITRTPYPIGMAGTRRIKLFAEYLVKNKNSVHLFSFSKLNNINKPSGQQKNVKYQLTKFKYYHIFFKNKILYKQFEDLYQIKSKNIIYVYGGIDITNYKLLRFAKSIGYKIVVDIVEDYSVHKENISLRLNLKHKIDGLFSKIMLNTVDGIVVLSKYLRDKYEISNIKYKVQLIPISAENINYHYSNLTKNDKFRFMYTGTFGTKDGIDTLLKAYEKLYLKNLEIELILSGKIGRNKKLYLNDYFGKYNIRYVGLIPESNYFNFINSADVLLTTRIESKYANSGFPFKLGEYLATGKPVISSNVSDINLYLKDGQDILLVPASDSKALYKTMEYALLNYEDCLDIGKNGYNIANEYFNPNKNGKLLQTFFSKI